MNDRIRIVAAENDPLVMNMRYTNLVSRLNENGIGFKNKPYNKGRLFIPMHISYGPLFMLKNQLSIGFLDFLADLYY